MGKKKKSYKQACQENTILKTKNWNFKQKI